MTGGRKSTRVSEQLRRLNISDSDDNADRLIIGLDFGTTYSGYVDILSCSFFSTTFTRTDFFICRIAYHFTTKPDQVYSITDWPGAKGRSVPKVPSTIKYSDNKSFQWGYELERTLEEKIEGIKLLLDPDQEKPLYVPQSNTEAELKKLGKPALDVATDYIGAIYQHAMSKIEGKYPKDFLDLLEKQFILSVPAIWSDKAKDATLKVLLDSVVLLRPLTHYLGCTSCWNPSNNTH